MKLIDKDAVVAEIEKLISNGKVKCQQSQENNDQVSYIAWSEHIATCGKILLFLDTLEVKEVDLEEDAELIANDIMIGVQANRYNTVVYNTKRSDFNHSHLMLAARKGIELGLKAYKGK